MYKCIDKALDLYHRPKEPTITIAAKAWLVNLACSKPKDFGLAVELWTQKALADYARKHAQEAGHPSLKRAGKATVNRILKNQTLQPHKVKYYLEKRDPAFELKMKEVLLVYRRFDSKILLKILMIKNKYTQFALMKNRAFKPLRMLPQTSRFSQGCIPGLPETMNTNGSGLPRFWLALTCTMAMYLRKFNTDTEAANLLSC